MTSAAAQAQYLAYSGGQPEQRGSRVVAGAQHRAFPRCGHRPARCRAGGSADHRGDRHRLGARKPDGHRGIRAARLRLIVGAPGSGKSTLLAVLIRPKIVDTLDIPDGYIKAAVFLDKTSTLESLAAELAAQLAVTVPGFADRPPGGGRRPDRGGSMTLGSFDTAVRLPLARCRGPGLKVPIIVDGLDQPQPGRAS